MDSKNIRKRIAHRTPAFSLRPPGTSFQRVGGQTRAPLFRRRVGPRDANDVLARAVGGWGVELGGGLAQKIW